MRFVHILKMKFKKKFNINIDFFFSKKNNWDTLILRNLLLVDEPLFPRCNTNFQFILERKKNVFWNYENTYPKINTSMKLKNYYIFLQKTKDTTKKNRIL